MGWKEARSRYHNHQTPTEQKAEDLVARHVLRGLGLTEKLIWDAERAVSGFTYDDDALWVRVRRLLKIVWKQTGLMYGDMDFEMSWSKDDHSDILKRLTDISEDPDQKGFPLFFTRVKGTETSLVYYCASRDVIGSLLKPPFTALKELYKDDRAWLVSVQTTTHFVGQFAPYTWLQKRMEELK